MLYGSVECMQRFAYFSFWPLLVLHGVFERALREIEADCLSSRDDGRDEGMLQADFLPL